MIFKKITRRLHGLLRPLSIVALVLAPLVSGAVTVQLVRNINTTLIPQNSYPAALGSLGGKLLFGATDAAGPGLWTTDGTAGGTQLLTRLSGLGILANSPWNNFVSLGSQAYVVSADAAGSSTVWITDGTAGGTRAVKAFPSNTSATASLEGFLGSTLIFTAYDPANDGQMYATDGTAAGTRQLTSFTGQNAGVLNGFIIVGNKFYFVASDTLYNHQIWVSDGTAAGTHQVTNGLDGSTATSSAIYNPQGFQLVGNLVLYGSSGLLWSIDSTTDTIQNVVTTSGSAGFGPPTGIYPPLGMGSFVLFLSEIPSTPGPVSLELWRSDGTAAGTYKVADVNASPTFEESQFPVFEKVGSKVLYVADDGVNGPQLWSSDGTAANTIRLTSATQPPNSAYPIAGPLSVIGSLAYFSISDGASTNTRSVWRTDGTATGTTRAGGLPPIDQAEAGVTRVAGDTSTVYFGIYDSSGSSSSVFKYLPASDSASLAKAGLPASSIDEFFDSGGRLFFSVNDPIIGDEPWVSDGTAAGTHLIEDMNPQTVDSGSSPDEFVNFGGRLAFAADDGMVGRELWISDGTAGGTTLLADVNPGAPSSNPNHLFTANGALYFFATDASGTSKFMRLAGAGVQVLAALSPQATFASYCGQDGAVSIGAQIYFAANDGQSGLELWTSDGTPQGTHLVADIAAGAGDSSPCYLTAFNGRLYFSAVGPAGTELWSSDGSSLGTVQVADLAPGIASSSPSGLSVFNGALYFAADDTVSGSELWKSDGSSAGTALVADLAPGIASSYPYLFGTLNGRLLLETFVNAPNPLVYIAQLWSSDGSGSGTAQIGNFSFAPGVNPLINGNQVFLVGQDAAGFEPWVSDGTPAGTHLLKDINPSGDSNPSWFENFAGVTVFEVTDLTQGEQLWRTDGTSAGTALISAISPPPPAAPLPTSARHRLTVGQQFFFAATDPARGTELYVLKDSAPVAVADSGTSTDDAAVTLDVLKNDTDSDGTIDPTTLVITANPAHGTAVANAGKILYTPSMGFSGTDSFSYTVKDNHGAMSAPATVTVTVTAALVPLQPPSHGGGGAINALPLAGLLWLLIMRFQRAGFGAFKRREWRRNPVRGNDQP